MYTIYIIYIIQRSFLDSILMDYVDYVYCVHIQHIHIADRSAQVLEIMSKSLSTNQNSAHGTYDHYHVRTWC